MFSAPLDTFIFNSNVTRETNRSGTTFEFEELAPSYVGCRAIGGNPLPNLRIFRDDVEITSEFDKRIEASSKGTAGLEYVHHEVTLYTNNYRANRDQREQTLKCSAKFHRFTNLRQNKQATIEVKCKCTCFGLSDIIHPDITPGYSWTVSTPILPNLDITHPQQLI